VSLPAGAVSGKAFPASTQPIVFHGPVGARPTAGMPDGEGLADGETIGEADGDAARLGATLGARLGGADAAAAEVREDGVGEAAAVQPTATITIIVRKGSSQRRDPWCGPEASIGFPFVGWARSVMVSESAGQTPDVFRA